MTQDMVKMMSQDKMIGKREILSSSPSPCLSRFLKLMLLLLIMTLGAGEMWGQPETGYYRLKSCKKGGNNWYYMCPATENNQFFEDGKPFLTTHQLDESNNLSFIWLVQKFDDDYYYIIHHEDDKDMYITTNDAPASNTSGAHRRRLHLEELGTPDAKEYLFKIGYEYTGGTDSKYNIWNKELIVKVGNENHKYLSISGDHNDYYGSLNDDRGMIGLYSKSNDTGVQWQFEPYDKCLPPVITCEDGTVSIECATEGRTIYYTTTGDDPDPADETQRYNTSFPVTSETTVKAIAVKDGYENSKIVSKTIKQVDAPTIAFDQTKKTITLSPTTEGVDYYYTTAEGTDAPDNPTKTTGTPYSSESGIAFSDNSITTINVIAFEDGKVPSASTTKTIIYMPDITLESESYTYDGDPKTPLITSVMVGETTVNDYVTPTYEDNIEAGTATVTIRESGTSDKIIYGTKEFVINPAGVTLIANSKNTDVYDGTEKTVTGYTCSVDGLTFAESVTASGSGTDAGNHDVTFSGVTVNETKDNTGNYIVTGTINGTLTINPASVTLTANSRNTDVYDGTEKTVTGFTSSVEGLTFAESVTASGSGTNAGEYDVTFTGVTLNETKDNTGNYVVTGTTNGALTINPAGVTLTANSRNTDVYDGTEKTVTGFTCKVGEQTVEGLIFAESVTASGSGTNAGEYDVTFTGVTVDVTKDNTGNYVVTGTTNGTLTIIAKEITISGITAENKEYDGTTDAVLVYTGVTFTGKLDGDILTVTATGTFEDKNVGTGKTVSITGFTFGGTGAANYTYNGGDLAATANIIAKGLTITGGISGVDKEYDGTTAADLDFSGATFDGKITGDDLSASGTGTFEDKEVGAGKTVTITIFGLTLSGADAGNYELAASGHQETTTATINVKTVTISGITASDKTYDGTTDATLDCTNPTIVGVVEGENLTVVATGATGAFDTKDVGTDKTVTISGLAIDGTNVSNYVLSAEAPTTTAKITQAELTVTAKDKSITYGDAIVTNDGVEYGVDDGNGGTTNNFVNGEGENVLGGTLAYAYGKTENETFTEYTAGNDAGYYDIVISGLTSVNYHINFVKGTLTVNAKEIGNGGITPNDGFTISFDEGNNIIVKDGETELTEDNGDITIEGPTLSASGRYSVTSVNGRNNYGGSVKIKYAITNFMNDGDDGTEWSATFVAEEDHALPDGISAYLITAIIGNEVTATPLDYIPGGVPVLLLSGADVDGFKVKAPTTYTEITDEQRGANKLKEVTADEEFPTAKIYLLYYNEFVLNMQGTLAAGKVYMLNPDYAPAPAPARLVIRWHQDTGIEDSTLQDKGRETHDKWYAFDGRRLNGKPTRKGLYIKNGQKTVIK